MYDARGIARGLLTFLTPFTLSAQPTRGFGAATYVSPPGWTLDAKPTVLTFARVRGAELCMVAIYGAEPSPSGLDAAYAMAWNLVFTNFRRVDRPPMSEQTSPAGYRHVVGEGEVEDRGGNRFVARLHVFPVSAKTQTIVWLANTRPALDGCRPEWNAFFGTLRFPSVAPQVASGAATGIAPPPAAQTRPTTPGSPQQFDGLTFVPPAGWTVRRDADAVHLSPSDVRGFEQLQVSILPGRTSTVSLESEFQSAWRDVQTMLGAQLMMTVNRTNYDLDGVVRSYRGWDYLRGSGGMRRADGAHNVDLYVIRAGDRVQRVAVIAKDFRDNAVMTNASVNPAYARAIRQIIFTLAFANQPSRTSPPARLRGGIAGVWNGIAMSFGALKTHYAIFFDNGTAYLGPHFPTEGLDGIDPVVEQPAAPRYWGTYVMNGETGVLTMPYGEVPLRRNGAVLELTTNRTTHRFIRLEMPASSLDGTWCLGSGPCLRLDANGRFSDAGAVRVLEHSTYAFPVSLERGEGSYALRDHTLVLRYDRGPEVRIAFPGLPVGSGSPREMRLSFNDDLLTRR